MPLKIGDVVTAKHCVVNIADYGCVTIFPDNSMFGAHPHDTHHYHVISHRLGYGDDIWAYCVEHEIAHVVVAEFFHDRASHVIWELAHQREPAAMETLHEEVLAQMLQRWARTHERPILGGVDWDGLKAKFLHAVGG